MDVFSDRQLIALAYGITQMDSTVAALYAAKDEIDIGVLTLREIIEMSQLRDEYTSTWITTWDLPCVNPDDFADAVIHARQFLTERAEELDRWIEERNLNVITMEGAEHYRPGRHTPDQGET